MNGRNWEDGETREEENSTYQKFLKYNLCAPPISCERNTTQRLIHELFVDAAGVLGLEIGVGEERRWWCVRRMIELIRKREEKKDKYLVHFLPSHFDYNDKSKAPIKMVPERADEYVPSFSSCRRYVYGAMSREMKCHNSMMALRLNSLDYPGMCDCLLLLIWLPGVSPLIFNSIPIVAALTNLTLLGLIQPNVGPRGFLSQQLKVPNECFSVSVLQKLHFNRHELTFFERCHEKSLY